MLKQALSKWLIFAWKIAKKLNCLKKSKYFVNLRGKIEMFFTRSHDPQISNQIDAVVIQAAYPSKICIGCKHRLFLKLNGATFNFLSFVSPGL